MATESNFAKRSLNCKYSKTVNGETESHRKSYSGSHLDATPEQMMAFFDACSSVTSAVISDLGHTDGYTLDETE